MLGIVALLTAALIGLFVWLSWDDPDFADWVHRFGSLPVVLVAQCAIFIAAAWLGLRRPLGQRATTLGFRQVGKRWILVSIAGVFVMLALNAAVGGVIGPDDEPADEIAGYLDEASTGEFLVFLLIGGLLAPFAEEMLFRGILFAWLARRAGTITGALVSATVFGLGHLPGGTHHAVATFGAGLVLAALYRVSGSLWPAILTHALNNTLGLTLLWLATE